jgi:hypothetical protein
MRQTPRFGDLLRAEANDRSRSPPKPHRIGYAWQPNAGFHGLLHIAKVALETYWSNELALDSAMPMVSKVVLFLIALFTSAQSLATAQTPSDTPPYDTSLCAEQRIGRRAEWQAKRHLCPLANR